MTAMDIVQRWQDAANRQDITLVLDLSEANIEIVGPRGTAHGHAILADWVQRAGVQFTALRIFARGEHIVVAQHGIWRSLESGKVVGEADVATSFQVKDQCVTRVARYDVLEQALQDAGLTIIDEYKPK